MVPKSGKDDLFLNKYNTNSHMCLFITSFLLSRGESTSVYLGRDRAEDQQCLVPSIFSEKIVPVFLVIMPRF